MVEIFYVFYILFYLNTRYKYTVVSEVQFVGWLFEVSPSRKIKKIIRAMMVISVETLHQDL